jgi:hypothetical protein
LWSVRFWTGLETGKADVVVTAAYDPKRALGRAAMERLIWVSSAKPQSV